MYTTLIKSINRMLLKMYSITTDKFSVIIVYCLQRFYFNSYKEKYIERVENASLEIISNSPIPVLHYRIQRVPMGLTVN